MTRLATSRRSTLERLRSLMTPKALIVSFFVTGTLAAGTAFLLNVVTLKQVVQPTAPVVAPLMAIAAVSTPKPVQYENQIRIHSQRGTVTLPVHKGSVSNVIGPVTLVIEAGGSVEWHPAEDLTDMDATTKWLFAITDVDGVTITGASPPPLITLGPATYFPEVQTFPLTIANPMDRTATITLIVGVDLEPVPVGGGGGLLF